MTQEVDIHQIDKEILNRFRFLRFEPGLERQFELDMADERCRKMIIVNYIAMMVYHAFLISDYFAIIDVFKIDLILHFAVMTPVALLANLLLSRRPPTWMREGCLMVAIIVLALTFTGVVLASKMPLRDVVQFDSVLLILFATLMQRLRFWYSIVTCVAVLGLYIFALYNFVPFEFERSLALLSTFMGIVLFSLVGCYNLEHETRMGYLLRSRDRIRNRDLEAVTLRDALTGVGNRRALEAAFLQIQNDTGAEASVSTAALLLDIDHFKMFNDTNGHQQGDACLKRVAILVAGALSTRGVIYRYGGEEFVVLLCDCTIEEAIRVAEVIRSTIARAAIPSHPDADAVVTVSIGAAAGRVGRDVTAMSLVAAADGALYTAKRKGRDRVWPLADTATALPEPVGLSVAC